ncbi:hypothetical protein D0T53_04855 [Dysgonomonas sp. 216]|uniref:DUF5856 family protein n=1 Tax=Dysgonomonas sp. 216 TaxID=2302934 RepID=UPI0013D56A47|nr:DUF5856 family protein [Dysgonomonas sp. 216]NDW18248.1 hypothetical protein [Dysgonomonas sp. 216]
METKTKKSKTVSKATEVGEFFGKMYSFNNSLKLFHWHVTGKASYAQHMALDQALDDLADTLDRIVETSYAMLGDITVKIPETKVPSDIVKHASEFFDYIGTQRELFPEAFTQAIIDDYQEAIQQLLYRLKRLQ